MLKENYGVRLSKNLNERKHVMQVFNKSKGVILDLSSPLICSPQGNIKAQVGDYAASTGILYCWNGHTWSEVSISDMEVLVNQVDKETGKDE